MKAVTLTSGRRAVPFRVEYLLDRIDLIAALAWVVRDYVDDEPLPTVTSRDQAAAIIRLVVRHAGHNGYLYWSDDLTDDRADVIHAWAEDVVTRLFDPLLTPGGQP